MYLFFYFFQLQMLNYSPGVILGGSLIIKLGTVSLRLARGANRQ